MRKYLNPCLILLLLFWVVGSYIYLPDTNETLTQAATQKLEEPQFRGLLDDVKVKFHGQEATLTGIVALEEEKQLAEKTIANEIRPTGQRGGQQNPVIAVHNEIRVDPNSTNRKRPWIIASLFPGSQRIDGVLKNPEQRDKLLAQIATRAPQATVENQILVNDRSLPATAWDMTLDKVPDFNSLLSGKTEKEQAIVAVTNGDGNWTTFPPTVTDAEIDQLLKNQKISPNEITHSLKSLRTWRNGSAEKDALEKAKKESEAAALADAQKRKQEEIAAKKLATQLPPYIGLTALNNKINLFGQVPSETEKNQAVTTAQQIYPSYEIDAAGITIDSARALPPVPSFTLPAGKENFIALSTFDGANKLYPPDVFDSEISKDFPALKFGDDDLSKLLVNYRTELASSGKLSRDEPYLAIATDGKSLILTGEVADIETKESLLGKVAAANPNVKLIDKLQVSSLVNTVADLSSTLDSTPNFSGINAGVAIAALVKNGAMPSFTRFISRRDPTALKTKNAPSIKCAVSVSYCLMQLLKSSVTPTMWAMLILTKN
ncbi:MAG: BON domain-containing protein [Akkermansiaceae bacterium]|nr:BON domain-containing protein [Akkermansiaceae bacterium]